MRFDFKFADLVFLNLPGESGRKFIHKANVLGNLVVSNLSLAPVADLRFVSLQSWTEPDPGNYDLAQALIRNPDNLHFANLWIAVEKLFDLSRIDVLSTSNDHVARTTRNVKTTVRSHHSQIARVQPASGLNHL